MIQSNSILEWTDIQNIYTDLRTAQKNFNLTQTTIPAAQSTIVLTTHLTNLVNSIEALSSQSKIGSVAITGVSSPAKGTIITPVGFSRVASVARTVSEICNFDSANFTNNFGFRSSNFTSDFGFDFDSSNFGFDSSDFSGDFGFDFDSSNFGFDSSDFSGDFGFRFNSSNFGFDSSDFAGFNGFRGASFNGGFDSNFNSGFRNFKFNGNWN